MPATPSYRWRADVDDDDLLDLVASHGGRAEPGWWPRVREHSLGWVTAHDDDVLVGFVNVAWDGGDHAFLLDTKTRPSHQRRGVGTGLARHAVQEATAAGCEWLHVDFLPELASFYRGACGFRSTEAGLVHLSAARP